MSNRWGKTDFGQLKDFCRRLERLSKADMDRFCTQAAKDLAGRLLAKVKKRTPVDTGALRDAWTVTPVGHRGDRYTTVVLNNIFYAIYVEYGHRKFAQVRVGVDEGGSVQYGKKYVGYQEPRYMLTISTEELERQAPAILERKLYKFLKGCLDAE